MIKKQKGQIGIIILLSILSMPVCAILVSYIGQGFGWLWGQIVDFIPLVNQVIPWLAERCGDLGEGLSRHELNVEFSQVSGAISGFWGGLWLPWRVLAKAISCQRPTLERP